jgi:PHD/YefM family antitoxin component YafN of YafNO toxin-antitoxin module
MLVDTHNLISTDEFRRDLEKFVAAAKAGQGPVVLMDGSEVVGVFLSAEEYEAMFGVAVRDLLSQRMSGPTVTDQTARSRVQKVLDKNR